MEVPRAFSSASEECFSNSLSYHPKRGTRYPAADAVRIKQSTVRMSTNPVWVGDPELMTCVATPSGVTVTKILWYRSCSGGIEMNLYMYNTRHPDATGTYKEAKGRMVGWVSSTQGEHNLYINRTVVSDQCQYYCTVTDDEYMDGNALPSPLSVQVRQHDHKISHGSDTFRKCEHLNAELGDNDGGDSIKLKCTVTSRPGSALTWTTSQAVTSGLLHKQSAKTCGGATGPNEEFTCTKTVKVRKDLLEQAQTNVTCRGKITGDISHVCVKIVIKDFTRFDTISIEIDGKTYHKDCEDVPLNHTTQNVTISCTTASRPRARISWSIGSRKETGQTSCVAVGRGVYNCTSNLTVALDSEKTKVTCDAVYGQNLTKSACVELPVGAIDVNDKGGSTLTLSVALVVFVAVVTSCSLRQ
ncbi:hypothetical protein LSAT2_015169 [Lamellibrachia satsuma]|nr:hypothetical protein LSAT2_015169 [Lamellibrachia satsuma]